MKILPPAPSFHPSLPPFFCPYVHVPPSIPLSLPPSLPPFFCPYVHVRTSLHPSLPPSLPPFLPHGIRAKQTCSLVLYGHTARVWDARLLDHCIVSIGEDATCRVWDYQGRCLDIVEGHRGRSIWSMALEENQGLVVRNRGGGWFGGYSVRCGICMGEACMCSGLCSVWYCKYIL